jgi:hypothetical protein
MSTRPAVPAGLVTAAGASHVKWFPLVKMELDTGTLYLSGTDFPVDYAGQTWLATRGLGTIDPITESADEITGLKFTLSGVPAGVVAEALQLDYQGRRVTVMFAVLDASGILQVDPSAWQGKLDVPEISRAVGTRSITITAEHQMADWGRPRKLLFNHADQQRVDPGDNFFLGVETMQERQIVLFSKELQKARAA